MPTSERPALLRRLAAFLVRGPDALIVLADLDELFRRDIDRGLSPWRAGYRYAGNAVASAYTVWRARRRLGAGGAGASLLDIKLGVRMLRKQPMLTGVAVLALGLGIPASLTVTHVWHGQMAPLPYEDGERIVGIRNWAVDTDRVARSGVRDLAIWREELTTFQAVAAARSYRWNVHSEDGRAAPVRGAEMTASAFDILPVPPLLGRTLVASDEGIGAPNVVVIGAALWASRFGGDPEILGKAIRIAGVPHAVIGVMPDDFLFPRNDHLWLPLRANLSEPATDEGSDLRVFGRLADGVSMAQARAEVETVGRRMAAEYPESHRRLRGEVVTMSVWAWGSGANSGGEAQVIALQFLPILLLMLVCGNVGIMILARTAARSREIAVRTALGASRGRIVSQLFVETLVLALLATGLGLLVANWSVQRFVELEGRQFAYWMDFGLGLRSVLLALVLGVFSAGVASLIPALKATGRGIQSSLRRAGSRESGIRFGTGSTALIVAEVALAVGTLSAGVVWSRTAFQDTTGDVGIELEHYLSARFQVPSANESLGRIATDPDGLRNRVRATQLELKRRIASDPGVVSVAMARDLPGEQHVLRRIEVEGDVASGDSRPREVAAATVDVDFLRDLGRPILQGRGFTSADIPADPGGHREAAIVNTSFVDQVLGGQNPIGRRVRYARRNADPTPWYEIVGVVGPLAMNPMNPQRDAGVYHLAGPGEMNPVGLVVEVSGDPAAFTPRLRTIAAEVDPAAMIREPMRLSDLARREAAGYRYLAFAAVLLSVIAILLSTAGLYALMSFTVTQRTPEIGIRTALGAQPGSIVYTMVRRAAIQLTFGVLLGAGLAVPILANFAQDPLVKPQNMSAVVAAVVAGTVLVGMFACFLPTLRGLRIQPMDAFREG